MCFGWERPTKVCSVCGWKMGRSLISGSGEKEREKEKSMAGEAKEMNDQQETGSTFTERLVKRIIDNIQISVTNIYFRFENTLNHNVTKKDEVFAIGLRLKEFSVFTTDDDFNKVEDQQAKLHKLREEDALTHKMVKIGGFTLFCDYEDLQPLQLAAKQGAADKEYQFKVF